MYVLISFQNQMSWFPVQSRPACCVHAVANLAELLLAKTHSRMLNGNLMMRFGNIKLTASRRGHVFYSGTRK